jgi:ACS family hexuronate transporter-like MFS transporter
MSEPRITRGAAWAAVACVTATMMFSYIDRTTLSILGDDVTDYFSASDTTFGWLVAVFSMAYIVGTPLGGRWIDRVGARRGLVISLALWSTIAALHAVAPAIAALFLLRFLLGLAEGPAFPGSAQTVQRMLDEREQSRGFGVLFTGSSLGAVLTPIIATSLSKAGGWRLAFLGTPLFGLLWIPLWLYVTRSPAARARLDAPPAARGPTPAIGALLRDPVVVRALLGIFAAAPLMGFVQNWGAKYLHLTFGIEKTGVGKYLWMPGLAFDLGAVVFGDLASRKPGSIRVLYGISMAFAASVALLPFAHTPWMSIYIASSCLIGSAGLYTIATAEMLSRMPGGIVSFAGGVIACAQSLAFIIVNPIIGATVDATSSYDTAAVALGAWVLPGSLAWIFWRAQMSALRSPASPSVPS